MSVCLTAEGTSKSAACSTACKSLQLDLSMGSEHDAPSQTHGTLLSAPPVPLQTYVMHDHGAHKISTFTSHQQAQSLTWILGQLLKC